MLGLEEIQTFTAQVQTLGKRERILDGQTHIGHAELGLHRAVLELYGTVNDRLRVDEHLYLFGIDTEEPLRLNHLEALVHHRGRVDGDLRTHVPGGMAQGIGLGDMGDLFHRLQTEGAARGCQ